MKALELIKEFKRQKLGPFIEVPCSLLAPVITELMRNQEYEVINPVNEAISMGIAAGSFLATGRIPVVLTQNSGLCNTLNALTSLNMTYKIPLLYLISWRGQPGTGDAPEHIFLGNDLEKIMGTFDLPYKILTAKSYKVQISSLVKKIKASQKPGALLLTKGLIDKEVKNTKGNNISEKITMANAINAIITVCNGKACYVTTNGYISREALHALSVSGLDKKDPAFFMLGSMGHALPIGLGVAKYIKKNRKVVVLDGDGGCLMHMETMVSVGNGKNDFKNLIHIVLDNGVYASVGNQPTVSGNIDFKKIADGCGYRNIRSTGKVYSLRQNLRDLLKRKGPSFLHVRVSDEHEPPKPRVSAKYTCEQIKDSFAKLIR